MAGLTGRIFNIQRFSTEDGPGIRTTVFLKGCPLKCLWCSNPESQNLVRQPVYRDSLCKGCGDCITACPTEAITPAPDERGFKIKIDLYKCKSCGACIEACTAGAIKYSDQTVTSEEVFEVIKKDMGYYLKSQGGVTASGGEPLIQADFVSELFKRCRASGIHTAVETSGYVHTSAFDKVLEALDLVLFDIKMMDSEKHKKYTGVSNEIILRNAKRVAQSSVSMIIRIPIIPGINDSEANLNDTALFALEINKDIKIELLPYHNFGIHKYKMLGMEYRLNDIKLPEIGHMESCREIFQNHGLDCSIL